MKPLPKSELIRSYLYHRPEMDYSRIATVCGTTVSYVQKQASELRRRGVDLPARSRGVPVPGEPERLTEPEHSPDTEPVAQGGSHDGAARVDAGGGVEFVRVSVTGQRESPAEGVRWECVPCGAEGPGEPPAVCPRCGDGSADDVAGAA